MTGPINLDENGHIIINDSMSEELKEKVAQYNQLGDSEVLEEEYTDTDDNYSDSVDGYDSNFALNDDDEELEEVETLEEKEVSEEELDNLNNLFM